MRGTRSYLIVVFSWLACWDGVAQSGCVLKKNQDGIKVYTCHTDTSRFKSIVTELTVHATADQLINLVMDIPNYPSWQYNTIDAKVIKNILPSEQIYRTVIAAPWPVSNRDMVVHIRILRDEDSKNIIIQTDSEAGVIPEKKGLVRVPSSHARWIITSANNQLQIKYLMQIDPGGSVPAWLVNWVCAQAPYLSFKKMKNMLEQKKTN